MSDKLKVGLVGALRGAGVASVFPHRPDCEVVAVCDLRPDLVGAALERFPGSRGHTDFDEMLDSDIDLVVVGTPPSEHAPQSIKALQAGKHVLSEVPAVDRLEECESLVAAAQASKTSYMLAENMCYAPYVEAWRRLLEDGRLGEPIYAEGEYLHDVRHLMRDADGGLTWRAHRPPIRYLTHDLGPLLSLIGGRCVTAIGWASESKLCPGPAPDIAGGLFQTDSGVPIKILCAFSIVRPSAHYWVLYGTKGTVETPRTSFDTHKAYFEDIPNLTNMIVMPFPDVHPHAPPGATAGGHGTWEYYMVDDFVRSIREGRPSPIDIHRALDFTVPGLCAEVSIREGSRVVELPDFR